MEDKEETIKELDQQYKELKSFSIIVISLSLLIIILLLSSVYLF